MLDFLLSAPVVPFSLALGLLAGLLVLEIVALLLGGTLFGKPSEAEFDAELDGPADLGIDAGVDPGLDTADLSLPAGVELADMDLGGLDAADLDLGPDLGAELGVDTAAPELAAGPGAAAGLAAVLGLGRVPFLIWLAAVLAGFGLSGYLLQSLATQFFGAPLPVFLAVLPAGFVGLWFARGYGRLLARLIPGTESSVRSKAMLNRSRGVVSQGVARAGQPAEVRITDSFGNLHFIRAEPLDQTDAISSGTEVLVLRIRQGKARGQFRILPLSNP